MAEEEIELDLGLSIGGSFGKPEKLKPVKKVYALTADSESNGFDVYVNARDGEHVDPLAKREMHALRRQEAKRKREEKQEMKRGTCRAKNGEYGSEWGMEEEPEVRKRERTDEQMQMQRQHNGDVVNPVPFPAVAAAVQQYPYAPVQYVPFTNGGLGGFPCVMPCWVPGDGAFEPSTWRGFKPYKGNQSLGFNLSSGCEKGEKDGVNGETTSYGSPICGSSAGSEDHSSSHEGGGSSDSRSRSCPSLLVQPQSNGHKANDHSKGHSENSASSEPVESDHGNKVRQSNNTRPEEERTEAKPKPSDSTPSPAKETKIDMGKPPKPQTQNQNTPPPPPPQMPYVSTTGNGPNGKTVTGFLYRYSKSEVSIVCVCHGSTFSPAEFVQHAGGTDVSHPLRNITVIPSAFG